MADEIEKQAEKQASPISETQVATQLTGDHDGQVNKSAKKNKRIYFVVGIAVIVIVALFLFYARSSLFKTKQENTGTTVYKSGYSVNEVTVQMPNDELIQRYPEVQPTIVGLNVYENTFEGLVELRGPNIIEPGLAVSWTNPNPTTWRFNLRRGVHFQSGDLFTAKDVKYTIDECKVNTAWLCNAWASQLIDKVNIINDYTVDLTTATPNATLVNWLYFIGILSQAQVARDGLSNDVGTGPYKIGYIKSREAELIANDNYWGGVPKVKILKYNVITDPNKAIESLQNGSSDIIFLDDDKNHNNLLSKGFYESTYNTSGLDYINFDVNDVNSLKYVNTVKNPFHDIRVRKAIYLALNLPQLVSSAHIDAEPVTQFATPDLVGYNPSIHYASQNLTEAKQLLAQAGFPNGFTVDLDSDSLPAHERLVNQIKQQLAPIGIKIIPQFPNLSNFYVGEGIGNFSMLLNWYYPDTLDSRDFLDTLLQTPVDGHGSFNTSNISDPQLDAILNEAESSYDTNKRVQLTEQAQVLAMQKLYAIPICTENFQVFARNDISYKASINMLVLGIDLSGQQKVNSN